MTIEELYENYKAMLEGTGLKPVPIEEYLDLRIIIKDMIEND